MNVTNEHGNTALHYACFWGNQAVAEELVTAGALVSIANKDGDTPLDKARGHLAKRLHGTYSIIKESHCCVCANISHYITQPCVSRLGCTIWAGLEEDSV